MIQILMGLLGLCFGAAIASGVVAFIISLGIVPRYAGITRTAGHIMLYENCAILGAIAGNLLTVFRISLPVGEAGLLIFGTFAGIFLGSWIVALGEVVDIYAILFRRIGLVKGIAFVIISMALGKTVGSLLFFWKGW
ncbi:MAG: stage V sporulation protein AB [Ruminococcus sp.]|jgi:stage V sporulation protein AB